MNVSHRILRPLKRTQLWCQRKTRLKALKTKRQPCRPRIASPLTRLTWTTFPASLSHWDLELHNYSKRHLKKRRKRKIQLIIILALLEIIIKTQALVTAIMEAGTVQDLATAMGQVMATVAATGIITRQPGRMRGSTSVSSKNFSKIIFHKRLSKQLNKLPNKFQ